MKTTTTTTNPNSLFQFPINISIFRLPLWKITKAWSKRENEIYHKNYDLSFIDKIFIKSEEWQKEQKIRNPEHLFPANKFTKFVVLAQISNRNEFGFSEGEKYKKNHLVLTIPECEMPHISRDAKKRQTNEKEKQWKSLKQLKYNSRKCFMALFFFLYQRWFTQDHPKKKKWKIGKMRII